MPNDNGEELNLTQKIRKITSGVDLQGYLTDAIRDTMLHHGGVIVSFETSENMAIAALEKFVFERFVEGTKT